MELLTQQDVLAHQAEVPWPSLRQVEQDLLLCRAMAAIFNDKFLCGQIAMRGGTLLHKVHLAPPSRFSEDIDLVVYGDRPEDHIRKALRRVLAPVFGPPKASAWEAINLAVRNTLRPSRILRMTYAVRSVMAPEPPLQIIVEANVNERKSHRPITKRLFEFPFRRDSISITINGYDIHEMLGTKMRALFQRRRGRDLFDLYWALEHATPTVEPEAVVDSFVYYLKEEGTQAGRDEFVSILETHLADRGFRSDTDLLLRSGVEYDPDQAGKIIKTKLLQLLPGG
jgi:predicted nucleotidyltransferase component of viral defense system